MIIAIVGAESSGKTVLAEALAARLALDTGLACKVVPEWLRLWCDREGRVPRRDEQAGIAERTWQRIEAAAATHDVVVADTTPLMTAVYSAYLFDDRSLVPMAIACQRRCAATLLTALDLDWQPDGRQRDGAHVQAPVDAWIRRLLAGHELPWSVVSGTGSARLDRALDAVTPLFAGRNPPRAGLFTRLAERQAAQAASWRAVCTECDVPECEHLLRAGR